MAVAQPDQRTQDAPRRETIEELFHGLESPLLGYAVRLTANMEAAEDIVQEAFLRLHRQLQEVREPRRWLYRTVHNLALNQQRAARKILPIQAGEADPDAVRPEMVDPCPLPDEEIARCERLGLVRLSVRGLDERSRELVRLKFNEDLSYKEISDRTGLKTGHVGYLLHHALKAIAAELARSGLIP
jgi:RNA polymerase sigma-70 factor (ECF subfamily)